VIEFLDLETNEEVYAEPVNGKWNVYRMVKGDVKTINRAGKEIAIKGDVREDIAKLDNEAFRAQFVPMGKDGIKAIQAFSAPAKKKESKK